MNFDYKPLKKKELKIKGLVGVKSITMNKLGQPSQMLEKVQKTLFDVSPVPCYCVIKNKILIKKHEKTKTYITYEAKTSI